MNVRILDLRDPETRAAHGLRDETVSLQSHARAGGQQHADRASTERAILDAIDRPLTRLAICRAIGRKKCPHLVVMIDGLAERGYIERETTYAPNGVVMYRYHPLGESL